jgi:hypothetical protein
MVIDRVEFISMTVMGPARRHWPNYKAAEWPRWTVALEGPSVVFEGEGRRVEVPRARCLVYFAQDALPKDAPVKSPPASPKALADRATHVQVRKP